MNRQDLLALVTEGRARFDAAAAGLTPDEMGKPALAGGRSVKDLLAHIGFWEARAVEIYRALAAGSFPSYPINNDQVNQINDRVLEENRARSLDAVREYERAAYRELLNVVETAPEADLFDPQRFEFCAGQPFYYWINWNAHEHFDEHTAEIQALAQARRAARAIERAGEFLAVAGRDIDRAVYDFAFGGLPAAAVLDVLARYQLADGGFTGLEVDIAAPVSNPFATELALRILAWIDPPRDHPVVLRVVEYLEQTQDEGGCWRFTPEVYQAALAPWFQGWQWPNLNPSGQIAGWLKLLGLGSAGLHARVEGLFERLAKPEDLASGEYYNVLPYGIYYQAEWNTPQAELYRWGVVWWLVRQHAAGAGLDATHFMELAQRPGWGVAKRLPAAVLKAKLDQLAAEQAGDGGWPTPYSPAWRPWITAQNALILKAFYTDE